jgi:hypothetical protein
MAALTAVMVFEKTGPAGQRSVRPIGLGLIVLGILVLADPAALSSPHLTGLGCRLDAS